jgi:hypothetical protein
MRMMDAAIIWVVLTIAAAFMAYIGGLVLDGVYHFFELGLYFNSLPNDWQTTGGILSMINLYYLACIMLFVAGGVNFLLAIFENESTAQVNYFG